MARPKNKELKDDIARAAARQFRERGYNATSYTTMAQECGISRNLAQYHWPKKELLAIAFMEDVLLRSQKALGYADEEITGDYQHIYEIGCCFFSFLLECGYRQFLLDVIESRDLTEKILAFNTGWALARVQESPLDPGIVDKVTQDVIVHMGGFYELLFHCLKNGAAFDVADRLQDVMRAFVISLGASPQEAASMFERMDKLPIKKMM